jgi:hypothetical protein
MILKTLGLLVAFAVTSFGASFGASVGFPSAPQSPGCTKSYIDGRTASCQASLNQSYGSSFASGYTDGVTYVVFAMLLTTKPAESAVTVAASYRAVITEFAGLTSGGVTMTSDYLLDMEPVEVYDADGDLVGTLGGGNWLSIPFDRAGMITLAARHTTGTGTEDYASFAHVTMARY